MFLEDISLKLKERESSGLLRRRIITQNYIRRKKRDFSSNDYLSLSKSLRARLWLLKGVLMYGYGVCKSKYLGGYTKLHQKLEQEVATAYGTEDALIFSSGYLASIGTLQGLCDSKTIIIADKLIHASWIDACHTTNTRIARFTHNNTDHLQYLISKHKERKVIILTESVFSMHGTVIDIPQYEKIAKTNGAMLIIDVAHSLGILPCYKASYSLTLQVGTFSKACGGFGGYICGNSTIVGAVSNWGRTQIYSTTLPEYLIYYNIKAFRFTHKHQSNVLQNAKKLAEAFNAKFNGSAIVVKEFNSIDEATKFQNILQLHGIYAPVVRPPTVPRPLIRFSVQCGHFHYQHIEDIFA